MQLLKTVGRLVYDPHRPDMKKTHKSRTLIAELPRDDLDLYYQWFMRKHYGSWFDHELRQQKILNSNQTAHSCIDENIPCIARPMWGKHVTIVRGDEPGWKSGNWGIHHGEKVEIYYTPVITKTWKFWSLHVCGENLQKLRSELNLKAVHNFHITVAREII